MKINKRDISIVMILIGFIAAFCVYQFYFTESQEKCETIQKQTDLKKTELNDLLKVAKKEADYEKDMVKAENDLIDLVLKYPALYRIDDLLNYMVNIENEPANQLKYADTHFYEYLVKSSEPVQGYGYVGTIRDQKVSYGASDAVISAKFTSDSYAGMKNMIKDIYNTKYGMNFEQIELTYDNVLGRVDGAVLIHAYAVSDFATHRTGDETNLHDPLDEPLLTPVPMGVDCVFGPTVTPTPTLEEWLIEQGIDVVVPPEN